MIIQNFSWIVDSVQGIGYLRLYKNFSPPLAALNKTVSGGLIIGSLHKSIKLLNMIMPAKNIAFYTV